MTTTTQFTPYVETEEQKESERLHRQFPPGTPDYQQVVLNDYEAWKRGEPVVESEPEDFTEMVIRHAKEDAKKADTSAAEDSPEKPSGPFVFYQGDSITELPPKEWLIDQVYGAQDFVMIFGASRTGKTFVALDLLMCSITGHKFAGCFDVARPLTVAYLTNEGTSGIAGRFRAAAQWHKPTDEDWERLTVSTDLLQFVVNGGKFYVERFVEQWQRDFPNKALDLLVLDHLSGTVPGKGDSDQPAATLVGEGLSYLRRELGTGVIMLHHTGYDESHPRGMTNYKDIADQMLQTRGLDNPHTLACHKNKDGPKWDKREFHVTPIGDESCHVTWFESASIASLTLEEELVAVAGLIIDQMNKAQLVAAIRKELGFGRNKAERYIDSAVREGKIGEERGGIGRPITYRPIFPD